MCKKWVKTGVIAYLVFTFFFCLSVCADEDSVIDCSSNFGEYLRVVADLNRQAEDGMDVPQVGDADSSDHVCLMEKKEGLFAILLKTDGILFECLPANQEVPFCRVNGPDYCYTLYYSSEEAASASAEYYASLSSVIYAECDSEVEVCRISTEESEGDFAVNEDGFKNNRESGFAAVSDEFPMWAGIDSVKAAGAELNIAFRSWGAEAMHYDAYLPYASTWGKGTAEVAVVDSGIADHTLLDPRISVLGFDYVDADEDPRNDLYGHGTHVAGIVADCTQELPVYLYPIRVLNEYGKGKMSNVVNAVREAAERGVDVINLSIESKSVSQALDDAILDALAAGCIVVAAAGNSNCDTSIIYPAHLENKGVIVVGSAVSSEEGNIKAAYSNYGSSVDIYAYGSGIVSCSNDGGYVSDTGTSMAAPHISALSAILRLIHPSLSPEEAEERITAAATGYEPVVIPDLIGMVPKTEGFFLHALVMREAESIALPEYAFPASACEGILYISDNPSVAEISDGILRAKVEGETQITVSCTGFFSVSFTVRVLGERGDETFQLPAGLVEIEDEALSGVSGFEILELPEGLQRIGSEILEDCSRLRIIRIPSSVNEIGYNTFSDAILLCNAGSTAMHYAEENGLQYIVQG